MDLIWEVKKQSEFVFLQVYIWFLLMLIQNSTLIQMQEYKTAPNNKASNVKNAYGSPASKIKTAVSPKGSVIANKSPAGAYGIKVGQWKTQKNLNSLNDKSQNSDIQSVNSTSIKTINQQEVKSPKNGLKKQRHFPQQSSKLGSPRSTLKSSTITMRSKIEDKHEEKSAAEKNCKNCEKNDDQSKNKIKELEELVASLQICKTKSEEEIQLLKKQKKELEEKVSKFSGVLAENRKLIKEKVMKFSNQGEQIKKMNDRIVELEETISQMKIESDQKEREFKEKEDQLTQLCVQNMNGCSGDFPNLLEVQSQVLANTEPAENNPLLEKFIQELGAKKQENTRKGDSISPHKASQFSQSDIYKMLESKAQMENSVHGNLGHPSAIPEESNSHLKQIQKIKKEYDESLSQIQTKFEKKYHAYEEQIRNREESISKLQQEIDQISKNSEASLKKEEELSLTIKELKKQNEELKSLRNTNMFKKSLNSSQTNFTHASQKELPSSYENPFIEGKQKDKNVNRSMIISKLDRIKRISQRQNQIIMQIKQSSKISLYSQISGERSSISLAVAE